MKHGASIATRADPTPIAPPKCRPTPLVMGNYPSPLLNHRLISRVSPHLTEHLSKQLSQECKPHTVQNRIIFIIEQSIISFSLHMFQQNVTIIVLSFRLLLPPL